MTCIAAYSDGKVGALAYDSMTGGIINIAKFPRHHSIISSGGDPMGTLLIATTGSGRVGTEVRNRWRPPTRKLTDSMHDYIIKVARSLQAHLSDELVTRTQVHDPSHGFLAAEFIGIVDTQVFSIGADYGVIEPLANFICAGSGGGIAMGVLNALAGTMSPEALVRRAVEAAVEHDPHVGGPIHVLSTA